MSVPFVDTSTWIPLAVLIASLVGSGHCVGMCGGLVAASSRSRASWSAYHLGRLVGYLILGTAAGWIGRQVFEPGGQTALWLGYVSWAAALLMTAALVSAGVRVWKGQPIHVQILPRRALSFLYKKAGTHAFWIGSLTALLPCGWLHSFVLGAVATQSPVRGAALLLAFWLGTLPALSLVPWLTTRLFQPLSRHSPRVAALILISVGVVNVGVKVISPLLAPSPSKQHTTCH